MASPTARRFSTRRDSVRLNQQVQGTHQTSSGAIALVINELSGVISPDRQQLPGAPRALRSGSSGCDEPDWRNALSELD